MRAVLLILVLAGCAEVPAEPKCRSEASDVRHVNEAGKEVAMSNELEICRYEEE